MHKSLSAWLMTFALAYAPMGHARVDLSTLDEAMAGQRTQVLVLGSVHLGELPEGTFDPGSLEPLLDRLAAFRPEVITIEAISGEGCDQLARHPALYDPDSVSHYCSSPDAAKEALGLDVPGAIGQVRETLAAWPVKPEPAERRRLAGVFLAAGDRASALTQWLQLPPPERRAGDGLTTGLATALDDMATRADEGYQIGARLAARLGLQRVFPIDDHTGDALMIPEGEIAAFATAVNSAWDSAKAQTQPLREQERELSQRGDMLGLYRYINRPDVRSIQADSDFGAALRHESPEHYTRLYVAGWETRNLRMVANVREAFREQPDARVLSIVGASHKPWFDDLLGRMQGVDVVDVETVLGPYRP